MIRIFTFTDYGIAGTPIGDEGQCAFLFKSETAKSGVINSPRHPDDYPPNMNCVYIFQPTQGEELLITFDTFFLGEQSITKLVAIVKTSSI